MPWHDISHALGLDGGGTIRSLLDRISAALSQAPVGDGAGPPASATFSMSVIALCAKMSKADGVALQVEADAFERFFKVDPAQRAKVRRLWDLAKQDVAGYESYAETIARALAGKPTVKRDVLDALLAIALADGVLHPTEDEFLQHVADRFGIGAVELRAMRARFVHDPSEPYATLALRPDASDGEVKAAYRQLVREHHPDVLAGRGLPPELIAAAQDRVANINAAYDIIARERGLT